MHNRKSLDSRLKWAFGRVVGNATRRPRVASPATDLWNISKRAVCCRSPRHRGCRWSASKGPSLVRLPAAWSPSSPAMTLLSRSPTSARASSGVTAHTTAIADIVSDPFAGGRIRRAGNQHVRRGGYIPGDGVDSRRASAWASPSDAVAASVATIADAPIAASGIPTPPVLPEGQIVAGVPTFSGTVATFTDADPGGALADFTATINWGDGVTNNGVITGPVAGRVFGDRCAHVRGGVVPGQRVHQG